MPYVENPPSDGERVDAYDSQDEIQFENRFVRYFYNVFPGMRKSTVPSETDMVRPPVLLAWRIGLFLLISTIVQNLSYELTSYLYYGNPNYSTYTAAQNSQYNSLVFNTGYWGPIFGLAVDLFRVRQERYRPTIIIASALNALLFFLVFGLGKQIMTSYHAVLMVSFIMEVLVMFIYIPMNGVVIRYANNLFYNYFRYHFQQFYPEEEAKAALDGKYKVPKAEYNLSIESASRVGGLMAQAMVWRTSGSFLYSIFKNFTYNNQDSFKGIKPHIPLRYYMLICAIGSCVLLVQVLFLTKPKYFLDYRRSNLKDSTVARMYNNILYIKRGAVSQTARVVGSNFMFVLCFIFIYFALPDALYTTYYSFNGAMGIYGFSKRWTQSNSIVSSLGALVGCALYAAWMYAAHLVEHRKTVKRIQLYLLRKREAEVDTPAVPAHPEVGEPTAAERLASREQDILNDPDYLYEPWRANPFVIVLAGCIAWTLGIGFHFIGQMGSNNDKFNYRVFFIFQSFIAQMCLQFAFMPTLSLAALHAPFEYETAAFELYSVCTMGGGNVSSTLSFSLLSSLNATVTQGYWKFLLLTMFFRMFPMFIAPSLPKNREEVYLDRTDGEVEDMKREPFREAHSPVCAEESMSDRESDENSHYNVAP